MTQRIRLCENSYSEKCGKYNSLPEPRTTAQHDSALTGRVPLEIFYTSGAVFTRPRPEADFRASNLIPTEPPYLTISNLTPQKNGRGPVLE